MARPGNVPDAATCDHEALSARWRDQNGMADGAQPIGYICHRCHAEFLPPQVRDGKVLQPR